MSNDSAEVRAAAAEVIAAVFAGRSLDSEIPRVSQRLPIREHAIFRVMVLGTIRDHGRLSALVQKMVPRPPPPSTMTHALLVLGLYQMINMRSAEHAAINETVNAAQSAGNRAIKGLVNAVLRRFQRERHRLLASLPDREAVQLSYPDWMVEQIRLDWPELWQSVLEHGNQRAPITLRVNARRTTTDQYLLELSRHEHSARAVPGVPTAALLESRASVPQLPGYSEGAFSVQDASAQLAAVLLAPARGQRVLDACAAPGGKTSHLLEAEDELEVIALEKDAGRLLRLRENLARLRLPAQVVQGDGCQPGDWWDGKPFDRILLDAPCTGSGVIRRHPDIKWLRRRADIDKLAGQQLALLEALWTTLTPGGQLLYATCSIFRAEGDGVVGRFLERADDAELLPITAPVGDATTHGWRVPPGGAFDGFYYALIARR